MACISPCYQGLWGIALAQLARESRAAIPHDADLHVDERLAKEEELYRFLQTKREPRGQLKAAIDDALEFLRAVVWQDEGPFESIVTGRTEETARWISRRTDEAIAVLAWHLRTGTEAKSNNVVLLATLVEAFDLIRSRSGESPPVEAVKQRLKRMKGDYYRTFLIPRWRRGFHDNHRSLAWRLGDERLKRCGTACFPHNPADGWWEQRSSVALVG